MKERAQRFTARNIGVVETRPGCWNKQRIGVFDGSEQIGEYVYGYSSSVPFYAFEQDGRWFALISGENYTKTDVISLPDCRVVGGESLVAGGFGFCPVEFYVPAYRRFTYQQTHRAGEKLPTGVEAWLRIYDDNEYSGEDEPPDAVWTYERFGFRSGCVWGDDSSWKLQMLDLSRASEGIVTAIDIGYIELAPYPLRECLEFSDDGDDGIYGARISTLSYHNLRDPLKQLGVSVSTAVAD